MLGIYCGKHYLISLGDHWSMEQKFWERGNLVKMNSGDILTHFGGTREKLLLRDTSF